MIHLDRLVIFQGFLLCPWAQLNLVGNFQWSCSMVLGLTLGCLVPNVLLLRNIIFNLGSLVQYISQTSLLMLEN